MNQKLPKNHQSNLSPHFHIFLNFFQMLLEIVLNLIYHLLDHYYLYY